ncbi:hypothetical protein SVIOM342S_09166 [Streptomyces violaceorubidus]
MHEGVLVAEPVARRPPGVQVGRGVRVRRHEDPPETGVFPGLGAVVVLQLVEPLQVEGERAALAVEFDAQGVLAAGGVPGGLEGDQGAGGEAAGEHGGVVHGDLPRHAVRRARGQAPGGACGQRALPYEGLGEGGDARDPLPRQVLGEVDDVGAEVAERPRPGQFLAQPPGERGLRVDQPVLEVGHPQVPKPADAALRHHPPGQRGGRHPAVVEADHRQLPARPGRLGGAGHLLRLLDGVGERLLAQDVFPGGERGQRDLGVAVAGGADVDEVDVVPFDQGPPSRVSVLAQPCRSAARRGRRRRPARRSRPVPGSAAGRRPGPRCASPGSGRHPHEGVADHPDAQGRSRSRTPPSPPRRRSRCSPAAGFGGCLPRPRPPRAASGCPMRMSSSSRAWRGGVGPAPGGPAGQAAAGAESVT